MYSNFFVMDVSIDEVSATKLLLIATSFNHNQIFSSNPEQSLVRALCYVAGING